MPTRRRLTEDETARVMAASTALRTGRLSTGERGDSATASTTADYAGGGGRTQHVGGYTRRDGTYVQSYYRHGS